MIRRGSLIAVALVSLVSFGAVPSASGAAISTDEELTRICKLGSGADECNSIFGLASDPITGHLFAVDIGNNRVSEFTPWGNFVKSFGFDVAPGAVSEQQEIRVRATAGEFTLSFGAAATSDLPFNSSAAEVETALNELSPINSGGGSVSVEGVPGSPDGTTPYVLVITFQGSMAGNDVAQLVAANGSTPLSGGDPTTSLLVRTRADGAASGVGLESCTRESTCKAGVRGTATGQFDGPRGIAVDENGNIYVREAGSQRVQKFDSAGRFTAAFGEFASSNSEGIALCPALTTLCPGGALFVADVGRIQRFSLDGVFEGQLNLPGKTVLGVAFDSIGEGLYATYEGDGDVRKLDPSTGAEIGQPLFPLEAAGLFATSAAGEIFTNFEGKVLEYGTTGNPLAPPSCCEAEPLPPPNQNFSSALGGLGTNGAGDLHVAYFSATAGASIDSFIRVFGPGPLDFEGPPRVAPEITTQFASSVLSDGATVAALIDPHFFADTRYFVQYGAGECSSGACSREAPTPSGELLSSKVSSGPLQSKGVFLEGLTPGTVYHYRFVATSSGGGPVFGAEKTFTTPDLLPQGPPCPNDLFRSGPAARLPDCRAYEMVSPVDKNHGDIKTLVDITGYPTKLGQSSVDGEKLTYSSSRSFGDPKGAPLANQYLARRDGTRGWESEAIDAGLDPGSTVSFNLAAAGNPYKAFSADLCIGWFVLGAEPLLDPPRDFDRYQNVYRRDFCGGEDDEALLPNKPIFSNPTLFYLEPQGASADGKAAIVRVRDKLTPDAASGAWLTYYAKEGSLKPLCITPDGTPSGGNCSGGTGVEAPSSLVPPELNRLSNVTNAISDDGSRVYWTDSGPKKESGAGTVYLRINPGEEQSASGECEVGKACTVEVSETETPKASRFLVATPDGAKALFEVTEGAREGNLYLFDLETGSSTLITGGLVGLAGASEDLSRVYFVSKEVLQGTTGATPGEPNLYLAEGEAKTFITSLSGTEVSVSEIASNTSLFPIYHAAIASADGSVLTFISTRSLTGYDNTDLLNGTLDTEVYLYRVGSAGPVCVSCNPSGTRPRGRLARRSGLVGSVLPSASWLPQADNMLYLPRALSADGKRLFFESFDALLPRDVNGVLDVYEWESAASREACGQKGAELYVPAAAGCLSLISSGESPQDSEFVDASINDRDVFFVTNASLLPQDPGLFDIYDARVGGGFPLSTPPTECQGEACKLPPSTPNDPTPASSIYVGPGDLKKAKKHHKKHHKKKGHKKKHGNKRRAGR